LGWPFKYKGPSQTFARENRSRRNLHGNEKEGKKEETLTVSEDDTSLTPDFTGLLREAPLRGLFLFGARRCENLAVDRHTCVTIGKPHGFGRAILKMAARKKSATKHTADEVFIPDKLYFRIGEVATLCHLPAYVLRFWESEFPQLKPVKSSTGQRMYRKRDVESVLRIKQLLYAQGFTIAGARQHLRDENKSDKTQGAIPFPTHSAAEIQHIRQGLREILNLLSTRRTG
jgi:DNA-binding transcriptional MerR regulator